MHQGNRLQHCLVYVPVFNEARTIGAVIEHVRQYIPQAKILIVDDGSTDNSSEIAIEMRVALVRHTQNRGVGAALNTAITFALDGGYEALLQIDGDGQHLLSDHLIFELEHNSEASLIIGNRFHEDSEYLMSRTRKLAVVILRKMIYLKFGIRLNDPTSGFRFFRKDTLSALKNNINSEYMQDTFHVIKFLAENGFKIEETNSIFRAREHGESSFRKITLVRSYLTSIILFWL